MAAAKAAAAERQRLKEEKDAARLAKKEADKREKEANKLAFQNSFAGKAQKRRMSCKKNWTKMSRLRPTLPQVL